MLRNERPSSIIKLYYAMMIFLVFRVFTTRGLRWQHQFVCIQFKCNKTESARIVKERKINILHRFI